MKQLDNYILEKLHINKEYDVNAYLDKNSFFKYIEENGCKIFDVSNSEYKFNICLKNSTKFIRQSKLSYPWFMLYNKDDNEHWVNSVFGSNNNVMIYVSDDSSHIIKESLLVKDEDGFLYNKHNADVIINVLKQHLK